MPKPICVLLVVLLLGLAHAPAAGAQSTPPCGPAGQPAYEDSENGLKRLLEDIVTALKAKKKEDAEALAGTMLIPEPGPCFASIFGPQEGKRLEEMYGKVRGFWPDPVPSELLGAAKEKKPAIEARRIEKSAPSEGKLLDVVLSSVQVPVSFYAASYVEGNSKSRYSLGFFFYAGGSFRHVDSIVLHVLSTAPPLRIRVGGNVQRQRLVSKTTPRYPELARQMGIQGTVRLQVLIGVDGAIQELEVVSGPAELIEASVSAVRQWRYQPTLLNGLPVEVVSTIDVVFTLSR